MTSSLIKLINIMDSLAEIKTSTLVIVLALASFTYFIYVKYIKTYRYYSSFCSLVSSKYSVYIEPYYFFVPGFLKKFKDDYEQFGDCLHRYKRRKEQIIVYMVGSSIGLSINDPELAKEFFQKTTQGYYIKTTQSSFISAVRYIAGNGLVFSQGNDWKAKRKIMSTVFNYEFIKSKISMISRIAKETLDRIEKLPENEDKKEVKMDLSLTLQQIFGNVVIKCFFGDINLGDIKGKPIFTFFNEMFQLNNKRIFTPFALIIGPRYIDLNLRPIDKQVTNMNNQFKSYAQSQISQQIKALTSKKQNKTLSEKLENEKCGIIQKLIRQDKLKKEQKTGIQGQENDYYTPGMLVEQFKTFFLAGTQTTANATTVLLYLLSKHKEFQEKVRKQIDAVFGDDIDSITYQKLKQMKQLQKCQKETLRMYNPVPQLFSRDAVKDHYLGQIPIKKDTVITVSILTRHYMQKFYENPQVFNPDRWDTIDIKKAEYYSFLPFSIGQRGCLGQQLAYLQGKIAVIHILKRYKEIKLQKPEFRFYIKSSYAAQNMTTTFTK